MPPPDPRPTSSLLPDRNIMPTTATSKLRVRDVMTANPICVDALTTPRQLARILTENDISGVPVLNGGKRVVGVASKTDLLQWCVKGGLGFGAANLLQSLADGGGGTRLQAEDLGIVADFMNADPLTAAPEDSLADAANRMSKQKVHRLIVLDDNEQVVGIITSLDLLKAFPR